MAQQMLAASQAVALVGVHGAALAAYIPFLPNDARSTACLEIRLQPTAMSNSWLRIVEGLAESAGAAFFHMFAPTAPGCPAARVQRLYEACNGSRPCRRRAVAPFGRDERSVLWCNVTVPAWKASRMLHQVAMATARTTKSTGGGTGVR